MTTFEIFAIAWIPISVAIIVLFAFNVERIEGLFFGAHGQHPAE